ncbi:MULTISPECIES: glycoside hydrolase family 3 C-terminal domain-containing protein [unclassified Actinomyces]|uniref:glycoside hydrolase family 3 C-terminal domain-containing protein n=1 Tax=unclassified Actinomyces TaxID=2609248 RepID=UPI002893152C|nr:glycoside hydrolase family 3 C-terminal domain-containing protein [Actinomyces sp. 217892]
MVRRAGLRLITAQLRSYATRDEVPEDPALLASPEHRALAREVAGRAMTLLRNEPVGPAPVLPLSADLATIAVIGRLATAEDMGDAGSSNVHPPSHTTPLEGIRAAWPQARVVHVGDDDPVAAAEADVAVVVAGFDLAAVMSAAVGDAPAEESGSSLVLMTEAGAGGDRTHLGLRPVDEDVIRAVAAANPRTVVALVGAGTIMTESWRQDVPAVLMMWYAGMEGGHALADVLSGAVNPSGRLPFSVPTSEEHLPAFDRDATAVTYDRYHGQRLLDRLGVEAAYPLGWGLSYTTYRLVGAEVTGSDGEGAERVLTVRVTVANDGERDGIQVVQAYGRGGAHADETQLLGFATVEVPAGGRADVEVPVRLTQLGSWDPGARRIVLADGPVELEVGFHAHDPAAVTLSL